MREVIAVLRKRRDGESFVFRLFGFEEVPVTAPQDPGVFPGSLVHLGGLMFSINTAVLSPSYSCFLLDFY